MSETRRPPPDDRPPGDDRASPPRVPLARFLPVQPKARAPRWKPGGRLPLVRSLLVTVNYPPSIGGIENYYASLARRFPPGALVVSTPQAAGDVEADAIAEVPVVRAPFSRRHAHKLFFEIVWFTHLLLVVALRDIRFLHCGNMTPAGRICLWMRRGLGLPYAIYFHGMDVVKMAKKIRGGGVSGRSLVRVLDGASVLFANSHDTSRRLVEAGADPSRVTIVFPGVDVERFSPGKPTSPRAAALAGDATILTVGRYAQRKGVDLLIRALPGIAARVPEVRLVVAGRRQEDHLGALVAELELGSRVHFLGEVGGEELPDLYRAASVFAMPAWEDEASGSVEGFGIVYLEAAATGIPAIGGRSGGVSDAIVDGETGFLVAPRDLGDLSRRLVELLSDAALRRRLGENARRRVALEFTWDKAAARVMEAIRTVAASSSRNE